MSRLSGRPPPAPASTVSQGRCRPPSSIFGAVQASVIYIRIHSVDRLNSSLSQHHRQPNDRRQQWRRMRVAYVLSISTHQ